jgi:cytochrome c-type biogenesis protein CcmE
VKPKFNMGQLIAVLVILLSLFVIIYQATRSESTVTFYTPAEVYQNHDQFNSKLFRVSGLVVKGSRVWNASKTELFFKMTDLQGHDFTVHYKGLPPDLFKEGQGVVVEGNLDSDWNQKLIVADLLMVKHSEVYDTKKDHSKMREAKLLDSILQNENKK